MATLTWREICERFGSARNWWIATTGLGGPHSVPVWGVVIDERLYFYGQASAVRTRNLQADPRLVAHLESGDDVLILHGEAHSSDLALDDPAVISAYAGKYDDPRDEEYLPGHPAMEGTLLFLIEGTHAISWEITSSDSWVNRRWKAGES